MFFIHRLINSDILIDFVRCIAGRIEGIRFVGEDSSSSFFFFILANLNLNKPYPLINLALVSFNNASRKIVRFNHIVGDVLVNRVLLVH